MPLPIYDAANPLRWTLFDKVVNLKIHQHKDLNNYVVQTDGQEYVLPPGMSPNLAWLVESEDPQPIIDYEQQRLEPSESITIDPANHKSGQVVKTWVAVDLSAAQLDDVAVRKKRKSKSATVREAAIKMRNEENVSNGQQYALLQELVLAARLDLAE